MNERIRFTPLYRVRQFFQALTAELNTDQVANVLAILGPELFSVFRQLSRDEQYHAWCVWQDVLASQADGELQQAALLHDCGKARLPLTLFDRVWIVIGKKLFARQCKLWGQLPAKTAKRWQRPFICAERHPAWGAEQIQAKHASEKVVWLVANHQSVPDAFPPNYEEDYKILIAADNRH